MKKLPAKNLGNRLGTAVQKKGRERVEQILDAATELLVEEGYAQFTMRQLAERLGIRLSNLQYYFPSRAILIQKLLERFLDNYMWEISQFSVNRNGTPQQRVIEAIDYLLKDQKQETSCKIFWELWALSARNCEVAGVMHHFYRAYIDIFTEMLQDLKPEVPVRNTKQIAVLIVSMIEGLSLMRGFGKEEDSFLEGIEEVMQRSVLHLMETAIIN